MPKQRITLAPDGTVVPHRMRPFSSGQATTAPARTIHRLRRLISGEENPKICVVRGEGTGDVIMTTPVIHAIKQNLPGSSLTYATNTKYLDGIIVKALRHNTDIDEIIERQILNEADYDLIINLHCPCIAYEKRGNPPVNRIDLFAKHVGLALQDSVPRFFLSQEEIEEGRIFVESFVGEKLMMVQPSASCKQRSLDHKVLKQA